MCPRGFTQAGNLAIIEGMLAANSEFQKQQSCGQNQRICGFDSFWALGFPLQALSWFRHSSHCFISWLLSVADTLNFPGP